MRAPDGRPRVEIWGVLEDGTPCLLLEDRVRPGLGIPAEARPILPPTPRPLAVREGYEDLAGRPALWVELESFEARRALREALRARGVPVLEADVPLAARYLMDRGIRGAFALPAAPPERAGRFLRFARPDPVPASFAPRLRVCSIDVETSADGGRLLAFALAGCGPTEVHLVASRPVAGAVVQPDERALLAALAALVAARDPDVLTGWNVVDFDFRVLLARARALGVPLPLGRDGSAPRIAAEPGTGRVPRAEVPGRVVVDGIELVRGAGIRLEDYRLETAARTLLGSGKEEIPAGPAGPETLAERDPERLAAYNRRDAELPLAVLAREGLLELAVERSLLTGLPLDRVGASIAAFDMLYLPRLHARRILAPSVDPDRKAAPVRGGTVLEPLPGLYANVAVFDFRSLYPSLIRTFHLDPLAHARPGADPIVAPNGARFSREEAILPSIVEELLARRAAFRARGDRHAELAAKILANALFGVLGAASCRFFDPEIANAITSLGQWVLAETRAAFLAEGARVLYGDTDSIFVALGEGLDPEEARARAEALRARVERRVAARVQAEFRVRPHLELEHERTYRRFLVPVVRGGRSGSKKRYAGDLGDAIEIVGLEAIRRDWPPVVRRLQQGLLAAAFRDRPVAPVLRALVARVLAGELDEELVIRKGLRKGRVEAYRARRAPHVRAAAAGGVAGGVVRYVLTRRGPVPVIPGEPLPRDIDRAAYVERVLRPASEPILGALGLRFDALLGGPEQLELL